MHDKFVLGCLGFLFFVAPAASKAGEPIRADVIVYSATSGGVTASVAAANQGASVVLIEPGQHIGGMTSGGLSHADVGGQEKLLGGLTKEFFRRVAVHYGKTDAADGFLFEPHVAEEIFKDLASASKVRVAQGQRLTDVAKQAARIQSIATSSGDVYVGKVFIDASYEGDLMAKAGVKYAVGREGRKQYDEWLAGRMELLPGGHQFLAPVLARKDGKLLPMIVPQEEMVATGEGDGKIQGYCFRLCLTDRPENRIPITKPENYNEDDYELLRRYFRAAGDRAKALHMTKVPGGKRDVNSNGPVSTNLLGASREYPEASEVRRQEIWQRHLEWAQGLLWFVQNDSSVSDRQRDELRRWGLCKDEFVDTGGWPSQLYIREARRMLGEYVVTQRDLESQRTKSDSVGMCGYNIDLREVQWVAVRTFRFPVAEDEVYAEGYVSQPVEPWQIPYRCLTPKPDQCDNLLVPVCASMSTVAYGSFRMESGYMIAGQAAGAAAALAAKEGAAVQQVPYDRLRKMLLDQGQILECPD